MATQTVVLDFHNTDKIFIAAAIEKTCTNFRNLKAFPITCEIRADWFLAKQTPSSY